MTSLTVISPPFTEAELEELAGVAPVKHEWSPDTPAICLVNNFQALPDSACTVFYHCVPKFSDDASFLAAADELQRVKSQAQPQQCVNANAYTFPQLLKKLRQMICGQPDEPQTIVLVPTGIPALGKSTLVASIQELLDPNWSFAVVSSDIIRRDVMDQYMRKNRTKNRDLAFDKTCKTGPAAFFQKVEQSLNSKKPVHILVLDKNHPPNAIERTLDTLKRKVPKNRQLKTVLVLPETEPVSIGSKKFPMSLSLLFQAMSRMKNRPEHETLEGSLSKRLGVQLMLYTLYAGTPFERMSQDFDYVVTYPYTDENFQPDEQFIQLMTEELRSFQRENEASAQLTDYIESSVFDQVPLDPYNFMERFIDILQDTRVVQAKPRSQLKQPANKPPLYIGVCLHNALSSRLVPFVSDVLEDLMTFYPNEPRIRQDFEELSQGRTDFQPSAAVSASWSFPQSLHLTTLFLGREKAALASPLYTQFEEGKKALVALKTLVYAPGKLICACAATEPELDCVNKYPHVTLLLGKWQAKQSNDLLEYLKPTGSTQVALASFDGESFPVFMYELCPASYLEGVTKAFD